MKFCAIVLLVIIVLLLAMIGVSKVNVKKRANKEIKALATIEEKRTQVAKEEKEYKKALEILSTPINNLIDSNEVKSSEFVSNKVDDVDVSVHKETIEKYKKDYF